MADPVRDQQLFQHDFALRDAAVRSARAYVFEVFGAAQGQRRRRGSDGLRLPSVLGRCFRDVHASTQHLSVDNNTLTQTTQVLLADQP